MKVLVKKKVTVHTFVYSNLYTHINLGFFPNFLSHELSHTRLLDMEPTQTLVTNPFDTAVAAARHQINPWKTSLIPHWPESKNKYLSRIS